MTSSTSSRNRGEPGRNNRPSITHNGGMVVVGAASGAVTMAVVFTASDETGSN